MSLRFDALFFLHSDFLIFLQFDALGWGVLGACANLAHLTVAFIFCGRPKFRPELNEVGKYT